MDTKKINVKNEKELEEYLDNLLIEVSDYFDEDLSLWEKKKPIDGIRIYKKKTKAGKPIQREEGIINLSLQRLSKNFLENENFAKSEIIRETKKSKLFGKFPTYFSITKAYPLFSARQFDTVSKAEEQPDGSVLVAACSYEAELEKDAIRGEMSILGWNLKQCDKDPNKTIASNVGTFDLKGSVPEFIMNLIENSHIANINKDIAKKNYI